MSEHKRGIQLMTLSIEQTPERVTAVKAMATAMSERKDAYYHLAATGAAPPGWKLVPEIEECSECGGSGRVSETRLVRDR